MNNDIIIKKIDKEIKNMFNTMESYKSDIGYCGKTKYIIDVNYTEAYSQCVKNLNLLIKAKNEIINQKKYENDYLLQEPECFNKILKVNNKL